MVESVDGKFDAYVSGVTGYVELQSSIRLNFHCHSTTFEIDTSTFFLHPSQLK